MRRHRLSADFLIASLVFTLTMAVYLFTLAPTVAMEDSGEFIAAVYVFGIPHPPGFPLYVLLGKLFTFMPLGTVAWRVNLMSAVFGALTVTLLYLVINRLIKKRIIALSCSLLLAFSSIFWSQSIIAEVYTLNSFFVALLLLLLFEWSASRREQYLLWFSFIYGLSLTNHTMMALLAPAFGLYVLFADRTIFRNLKLLIKLFGFFALGLTPYLYLPLRAMQNPLLNSGNPSNLSRFLMHVTRRGYRDFGPDQALFSKVGLVLDFFLVIYQQFFLPTFALAAGGLVYLFKKRANFAWLTVLIFLLNSLGIIILRSFGWGINIGFVYRVYYLPCFLVVVIWLAVIFSYLYDRLQLMLAQRLASVWRVIQFAFFIVVLSLPLSFFITNYQKNDLSNFWLANDYGTAVLESLEPNAVLNFSYDGTLQGDTEIFTYLYLQRVENIRPDVTVVDELSYFKDKFNLKVESDFYQLPFNQRRQKILELLINADHGPVYSNFAVTTAEVAPLELYSRSNGIVHRVYPSLAAARQDPLALAIASIRNLDDERLFEQPPMAGLVAHYYYGLAAFYLTADQFEKSQQYLILAFNLDNAPLSHEYRRHLDYRAEWLPPQATSSPAR